MPSTKHATPQKTHPLTTKAPAMLSTTGLVEFKPYELTSKETYMNDKQKLHFRHILEQMKLQLMSDVDQTMEMMRDEEKNFSDVADIATHEEVSSLILRTRNREGKLLRKIEESLELIDKDEFGYCGTCGVEIGIRRLEARPTATLCIDCKTLDEIREKQRGN
jgi:DnaK suppressor protein